MGPTPTLARRFWEANEPIHAVVYFAPEPAEAVRRLGLRGFWMGYFAGRFAPMGPVPPAITREAIQPSRGWNDDDWEQSYRRLQARGILDRDGQLTRTGGALRRDIEELTDRLAAAPVQHLDPIGVERAIALATPVSRHLIDSGVIPVPNPIGAPRP